VRLTRDRVGYGVIGIGVGGLVDGFVLHQILQWHHLWSRRTDDGTVNGLEENTLADGLFHLSMLVVLLLGLALLARRRVEPRPLVGLGLVGWGLFHLVDQLVFHLALGAHHIRMHVENPEAYDWAFAAVGVALIALGWFVARKPRRGAATPARA
jgi:uncharacterized membrane protein